MIEETKCLFIDPAWLIAFALITTSWTFVYITRMIISYLEHSDFRRGRN